MEQVVFIGGGHMASALVGGLLASGRPAASIRVVEPNADQRERLVGRFGVVALGAADALLASADLVVWAVKPQVFAAAAAPCRPWLEQALHLSVMAGVRSDAIARAVGNERVVRAMPNTPALIGQGIAGLFAREVVTADERREVDTLLAPTGQTLWVEREADLDAVTALSGSGPAYVFYVIEAMTQAAVDFGLSAEHGRRLALATFAGATALAAASNDPPEVLRAGVTSPGGTTAAALAVLEARGVKGAIGAALEAARRRAVELGDDLA